jgi:hypothetical protein
MKYGKRGGHVSSATTTGHLAAKAKIISQSRKEFVLLPARKIDSAANETSFKINHCGNFLTHS